ncbi:hypothetical protein LSH36_748g02003 [Paralvinella palmiformis]|uniref:Uncharacterized protein n=1 Tax=Paralvinella palmiformis TaxID=53620 RepID=A0AAD9J1U2_9ANNE|nr:hypothetical protein LSH36_748g02003 [Paralvinella palmiformis]
MINTLTSDGMLLWFAVIFWYEHLTIAASWVIARYCCCTAEAEHFSRINNLLVYRPTRTGQLKPHNRHQSPSTVIRVLSRSSSDSI